MELRNCGLSTRGGSYLHAHHIRRDWTAAIRVPTDVVVVHCGRAAAILISTCGRRRARDRLVQQLTIDATRRVDANPQRREDGRGGRTLRRRRWGARAGWQMRMATH